MMLAVLGEFIQFASHHVCRPFFSFRWETSGISLHKCSQHHKGLREKGHGSLSSLLIPAPLLIPNNKISKRHFSLRPSWPAEVWRRCRVFLCILGSGFFQLTTYCTVVKFQKFRLKRFTWVSPNNALVGSVFLAQGHSGGYEGGSALLCSLSPPRCHSGRCAYGAVFSQLISKVLSPFELSQHCHVRLCCACHAAVPAFPFHSALLFLDDWTALNWL